MSPDSPYFSTLDVIGLLLFLASPFIFVILILFILILNFKRKFSWSKTEITIPILIILNSILLPSWTMDYSDSINNFISLEFFLPVLFVLYILKYLSKYKPKIIRWTWLFYIIFAMVYNYYGVFLSLDKLSRQWLLFS